MNNDKIEKRRSFIINFIYFAIIIGIVIFIARNAMGVLLPFAIGLAAAYIVRPYIKAMKRKWNIKNNAAAIIAVLLFYVIVVIILAVVLFSVSAALIDFITALPDFYNNMIQPTLTKAAEAFNKFINNFDILAGSFNEDAIFDLIGSLGSTISTFSMSALSAAGSAAASLPGLLLNIVIAVIATAYLSVDWDDIKNFLYYQCSERTQLLLVNIGIHLKRILKQYITSYATIMLITFIEIFIGLFILKVNNSVLIAILIAVFDILPVVGSGIILLPWTVVSILIGDIGRAIGLFVLWAIVSIIRNVIEPKIVGDNVGLHPLVALMAMISGTYIFGPIGLLGFPVILALIQSLNDAGIIHIYQSPPKTAVAQEGALGFKEIFAVIFAPILKVFTALKDSVIKFIKDKSK